MKIHEILALRRPYNGNGETYLLEAIRRITKGTQDAIGNVTAQIGNSPKVCFVAHADTVDTREGIKPIHRDGQILYTSPREACLGADDAAGIYIMLELFKRHVSALYLWTTGEERGAIGARAYTMPEHVKACISLDRAGTTDIITHQAGHRCASDKAAVWIAERLQGYRLSKNGVFTDSEVFSDTIPECLNLSVGYSDQHTPAETLDIRHVRNLIDQLVKIDWSDMPIERDPSDPDISEHPARDWYTATRYSREIDFTDYQPDGYAAPDDWRTFDMLCRSDERR